MQYCWEKVRFLKGMDQDTLERPPVENFIIKTLLLYHCLRRREMVDLLDLPCSKVNKVLHLTHSHPI